MPRRVRIALVRVAVSHQLYSAGYDILLSATRSYDSWNGVPPSSSSPDGTFREDLLWTQPSTRRPSSVSVGMWNVLKLIASLG